MAENETPAPAHHPDHFVAEWREFRGWTQEELAEMVDVSHSKISRIERGETALKSGFLKKLARFFKVPASAIMDINPLTADGARTAELLTVWTQLSHSKQSDLLRIVRALAPEEEQKTAG